MSKKVLILEDNIDSLEFVANVVQSLPGDIEVYKFSSLDGIYELVNKCTIDLFIIDIVINPKERGDVSGLRFVDHIRSMMQYEFTPVIFTSGLSDPNMYAYEELRSFSYIEKPYDVEVIKRKVELALRYKSAPPENQYMYFRIEGIIYSVKCSEVVYAKIINRKMLFYMKTGSILEIPYKTCKKVIDEANYKEYVQCNRTTIINWNYVEYIDIPNNYIKLEGVDNNIEISVTHRKKVMDIIKYGI